MSGKKFEFTCILVILLTFSVRCLSYDTEVNNLENFYVKANYFGALFNAIGPLKGKEDAGDNITEGVFSFNKQGRAEAGYSPRYAPGFASSTAVGYLLGNMRVELEGLYSQTNLYDEDYSNKDKAKYIELRRNKDVSAGANCNSPWRSGKFDINLHNQNIKVNNEDCNSVEATATQHSASIDFRAAFKMKNEGFNNLAGMINVYHDFHKEEMPFTPYVGVGTGVSKIKFLGKTKYVLAYQAKVGVNFPLTTQTQTFVGIRYFGILGTQFKNIVPGIKIPAGEEGQKLKSNCIAKKCNDDDVKWENFDETARIESTTATITNRFGIYGLEFGLAYYF